MLCYDKGKITGDGKGGVKMADPERTNAPMSLLNRRRRYNLMQQLRAEQEGESIPGYAEYLRQMEELEEMIKQMSSRHSIVEAAAIN